MDILFPKQFITAQHSGFDVSRCMQILQNATDPRSKSFWPFGDFGKRKILCTFQGNEFQLLKNQPVSFPFSRPGGWVPVLHFYGRLSPGTEGTDIVGYFVLADYLRRFILLWLLGGAAIGLVSLVTAVIGTADAGNHWFGIKMSGVMLLSGFAMARVGSWLARDDIDEIMKLLRSFCQS